MGIQRKESKKKQLNKNLEQMVVDQTREIHNKENMLQAIFRATPVGIGVIKDKVLTYINPMVTAISGYTKEELVGQSFRKLYQNDAEFYFTTDETERQIQRFQSSTIETKWLRKDGTQVDILYTATPLEPENLDNGITFSAHDITQKKEIQEQLEKTREQLLHSEKLSAVGRLSASIAHEFNNPLYGIMNVLSGIQKRSPLSEEDNELANLALKECNRIKFLISELQQFNRPSSGVREYFDIHQAMDEILLFHKKEFENKKIRVKKAYGSDVPKIWAVQDQIKQVLVNLFNNAGDAMPAEGGMMTISTDFEEDSVYITVKDDGNGILPKNMGKIFEPFFTTKPAVKGTGLGLPVSFGIIKSHGGSITVESSPDHGSTFTITLPVEMRH
jgi:PAS domain S-box-containing protein